MGTLTTGDDNIEDDGPCGGVLGGGVDAIMMVNVFSVEAEELSQDIQDIDVVQVLRSSGVDTSTS